MLEDDIFLKDSEGHYFRNPDFHNFFQGLFPGHTSISVSKLAFVVFKVMTFLGASASSGIPEESANPPTGADAPDDVTLYKKVFKLTLKHVGNQWAAHDVDGGNPTNTLINIVKPTEACHMPIAIVSEIVMSYASCTARLCHRCKLTMVPHRA